MVLADTTHKSLVLTIGGVATGTALTHAVAVHFAVVKLVLHPIGMDIVPTAATIQVG